MEENKPTETQIISKKLMIINFVLLVLVVFMVSVINNNSHKLIRKATATPPPVSLKKSFDNLSLEAKSAYVFDIRENKVLFKKNEFTQLPLASITKLMMALTAIESLPKDTQITIKKEFLAEEGDTGLLSEESWRLKDLIDFSLIVSSNDGARSIASVVGAFNIKTDDYVLGRKNFVTKMNLKARDLGMKQTYFVNESGLDIDNVSGGYGSAIDVGKIMQYILEHEPEILEATKNSTLTVKSRDLTHKVENTNTFINNIPGLIASKTGYTELAGGNLAIAFDASIGRPIIVVVLGSSIDGRFKDMEKLVNASLDFIQD